MIHLQFPFFCHYRSRSTTETTTSFLKASRSSNVSFLILFRFFDCTNFDSTTFYLRENDDVTVNPADVPRLGSSKRLAKASLESSKRLAKTSLGSSKRLAKASLGSSTRLAKTSLGSNKRLARAASVFTSQAGLCSNFSGRT